MSSSTVVQHEQIDDANSPDAFRLSDADIELFNINGYIGPFHLMDEATSEACSELITGKIKQFRVFDEGGPRSRDRGIAKIKSRLNERFLFYTSAIQAAIRKQISRKYRAHDAPHGRAQVWSKGTHILVPEVAQLGMAPPIIQRLCGLLGEDVLLWGSQLMVKKAVSHRWHEDVEHNKWQGLTVWLGLSNVSSENTIKLVPGSHRFGITPQELAAREGIDLHDDQALLGGIQASHPQARVTVLDLRPGSFVILAGRTWHASLDVSDKTRTAMIYQYCKPTERVMVPLTFDPPETKFHPAQPWVMLAAGQDTVGINHIKARTSISRQTLSGKTAMITGGSRGIGLAMAARLAAEGARIGLLARDPVRLEAAARMLRNFYGAMVSVRTVDVNDANLVEAALDDLELDLGPFDTLVNNVGQFQNLGPFWEISAATWISELSTNLIAPYLTARHVARGMAERKAGLIVNLAGGGAGQGIPFGSSYSTAKAGLVRLTECMAEDLKDTGVRVYGLDPGLVKTRMTLANATSEAGSKWRPQIKQWLDHGSDISPECAADLVVELVTGSFPEATGKTLFAARRGKSSQLRFQRLRASRRA